MNRRTLTMLAALATALLLLVAAGCSDSDDGGSSLGGGFGSNPGAAVDTGGLQTGGGGGGGLQTDGGDGGGGGGGDVQAFCDQARKLEEHDGPPTEELLDEVDKLVEVSPSEIKDDVETLRDGVTRYVDARESDDSAAGRAIQNDPEYENASDHYEDYVETNCEFEDDGGAPAPATRPSS